MPDPTLNGHHYGFVVDSKGTAASIDISAEVSAAYDILTDAGFPPERAAEMAANSERLWKAGEIKRTPEQFARHIVSLRKAVLS